MPASVIVGLQWGDEGKGKTTDFLAEQVSTVIRYQGGDNAGHTIVIGSDTFKLHLVPSGVLYPHITPVIGPGVVVNPATLLREFDELTARGIGPAYEDRAARLGLRVEDLVDPASAATRLARVLPEKRALLEALGSTDHADAVNADLLVELIAAWGKRLQPHIADSTRLVQAALAADEHILLEGAQGTLLDLDHGSYPFVTSSNPIAGGATTGGGIAPLQIDEVMGVMKAYATRVGSGPFVTELTDAIGERIASTGHEVGTTTGRRRRVGWNDAVPLRYAVQLNGVSSIMLNKLDVLSGIPEILLCVAYEIDGVRVEHWPASAAELSRAKPIYERFPGWDEPIHMVRTLADLPENARRYVTALEEVAGAPIVLVSVGPERTQTIERAWRPLRRRSRAGRG